MLGSRVLPYEVCIQLAFRSDRGYKRSPKVRSKELVSVTNDGLQDTVISDNSIVKDVSELFGRVIVSKQYKLCFFSESAINVKDYVVGYVCC